MIIPTHVQRHMTVAEIVGTPAMRTRPRDGASLRRSHCDAARSYVEDITDLAVGYDLILVRVSDVGWGLPQTWMVQPHPSRLASAIAEVA